MFYVVFASLWLFMFFFQFRRKESFNGYVDMKNYTFCSNLIFTYPKLLVCLLFFNCRLVKFPFTILLGQILNYVMILIYWVLFASKLSESYILLLKIYGGLFIVLSIIICIDHEIFCLRKHK